MRKVQVYIEGEMLDLFNDEQITLNSSVQNIQDLSKVFTDYSQSFTVPATKNNNKIFSHWYNSDVEFYDASSSGTNLLNYDANTRRNGTLEINLTHFRQGKIQLEKANLKKGKVDSYSITFYGDVTSMKDKFGDDMLSDLDMSSISHTYNGTQVYNRIIDHTTDYDVRYPLITSTRNWNYGGSPASDDISQNAGQIFYTELFPAIKIKKIFDVIASKYGLTFNGNFLSNERFTKCFLWAKNQKEAVFVTDALAIDFSTVTYASGSTPLYSSADATTNSISYQHTPLSAMVNSNFKIDVSVTPSITTVQYYIDVYRNGTYSHTATNTDIATTTVLSDFNTVGLNETITLEFRADLQINVNTNITAYWETTIGSSVAPVDEINITCPQQTLSANAPLSTWVPEMKVEEFFSGVLKVFNLTCYGTDTDVFQIEPLDDWYSLGEVYDITTYTDVESIDVNRVPLYSSVAFKYQESESVINKGFKGLFKREYGNAEQSFQYDGGEYSIELPFENLMQQKFTGTDTQVGYALDQNLEAYTPAPCLMYMNTNQTTSIKFYDGASILTITNYMPFGQDLTVNSQTDFSLNFSADKSTFTLQPSINNLYKTYYEAYLLNLFNLRNRLINVKTQLPIKLLTELKLNDRLVIRDKRYVINEMKSNLNTGEVNFTLLLDFRDVRIPVSIPTNPGANCVDVPITLGNGVCSVAIATTTGGVTITPSSVTSSQIISVCVPANANTIKYIVEEDSNSLLPPFLWKYVNTENNQRLIGESSANQIIALTVTETYCNGAVNDYTIYITQP
jgi:hypothetical protein